MRRILKISAWVLAVVAGLPAVLVVLVIVAGNMEPGRRMIERATARETGGEIVPSGLSGRFPDRLRLAHLELRDARGPWLSADEVTLDWSSWRLLTGRSQIKLLQARHVLVERIPSTGSSSPRGKAFRLPVRLELDRLIISKLDIGAAIAREAASVELQGHARMRSLQEGDYALEIVQLDGPGRYSLSGAMSAAGITGQVEMAEPAHGLVARLIQLPDVGAVSLKASVAGPRNAEGVQVALSAGPLMATAAGTVDLVGATLGLQVDATAPSMHPREGLSWEGIAFHGHVRGPFGHPDATAQVRISGVQAAGAGLRSVTADLQGDRGNLALHAVLEGLRLPGPKPDLMESAPLDLRATVRLDDPARPVTFELTHPLLRARGRAETGARLNAAATIRLPALAPLASTAGLDLQGHATINAHGAVSGSATLLEVDGIVGLTGGTPPFPGLIGDAAKISLSASISGTQVTLAQARVEGRALSVSTHGTQSSGSLDLSWQAALSDLAVLAPNLSGQLTAQGRLHGAPDNLSVSASANGEVGASGLPRGPIQISLQAQGLPGAPSGALRAQGVLGNAPLEVAASIQHSRDGTTHAAIEHADWMSAHASGEVTVPASGSGAHGRIAFQMKQLGDLQPWVGATIQGSVAGTLGLAQTDGQDVAILKLEGDDLGAAGAVVSHVTLAGRVLSPAARPVVAVQATADGIAAYGINDGRAQVDVNGPENALAVTLSAEASSPGNPRLSCTAAIDAVARRASVTALQAQFQNETLRLLQPASVSFSDGLQIRRVRVGMQQAVLDIAGGLFPSLDVTASLRNVTPALLHPWLPDLQADGTLSADARLTGSAALPRGNVRLSVDGARLRTGPASALPAAKLSARADLAGETARLDAQLNAGTQVRITLAGTVPLQRDGAVDLHGDAVVDAAVANAVLEASGRRVQGQLALKLGVVGTAEAPRASGTLQLAKGDVNDFADGAHLTDIAARGEFAGDTFRLTHLSARAGTGTIEAAGTVGILASDVPVDLTIAARRARPLASDLLTADMDADLTVRGEARKQVNAAGIIRIERAEINIPNALPPNIVQLDVRRPGRSPAATPPRGAPTIMGMDIIVDAAHVFVRGRGLDAELGGKIHAGGTTQKPQFEGGFDMRRGTFDLAGSRLTFNSGKVSFSGSGVKNKLDPTLDFVAQNISGGVTATLHITGFADQPKFALSSTPELPQDEILSRLIFGQSAADLTPVQLVQIGAGLASLTGAGSGVDPLARVQKSLGLDRLSVSGGSSASGGTSVEAGRYVAQHLYVGARQTTSGVTQAQVQFDVTRRLKLQSTLGTGGGSAQGVTPENDPGSSVGLSYQLEY